MMESPTALYPEDIVRIEASSGWRTHRIEVFTLDDGKTKVLVKGQRPQRSALGYQILNMLAKSYGLPWLQAAPAYGASKAQNLEFSKLQALRSARVLVPIPLYLGSDYIVMSYLEGREFLVILSEAARAGQDAYLAEWQKGLEALQQLHHRGLCLSQAFARNMLLTQDGMAYLDFEDDPLEVMSLTDAQARDYALYLHSTALWIEDFCSAKSIWHTLLAREPMVRDTLLYGVKKLAWLRHLPGHPTRYGRDTWRVYKLGKFLNYLA